VYYPLVFFFFFFFFFFFLQAIEDSSAVGRDPAYRTLTISSALVNHYFVVWNKVFQQGFLDTIAQRLLCIKILRKMHRLHSISFSMTVRRQEGVRLDKTSDLMLESVTIFRSCDSWLS
jgi:hypothetical protein